jgi:hypothetical protein
MCCVFVLFFVVLYVASLSGLYIFDNIASDEGEVDYWKGKVIAFVVEFCF